MCYGPLPDYVMSLPVQASNVFAGKHGFITPRDLFRWAERGAVGYEQLAENGFAVLGERLRHPAERATVVAVLQKTLNVKVRLCQRARASCPAGGWQARLSVAQLAHDAGLCCSGPAWFDNTKIRAIHRVYDAGV